MNLKSIVDSLAHSEMAQQLYSAVSHKWGAVGLAVALAVAIVIGVLVFGYDVSSIQAWFAGLSQ